MHPTALPSVAEILALLDGHVAPLPPVTRPLDQARDCLLAEAIRADADQPGFDRAAMDGFAVAAGSPAGSYDLAGEILPGDPPPPTPATGQVWRIFTGAAVPEGCAIVRLEETATAGQRVTLHTAPRETWIRRRGSSIRAGQWLLPSGSRLGPGETAVLASVGATHVRVIPPPRVLHLTTGREIVPSATQPAIGQTRDTNGPLIQALLAEAGALMLPHQHVDESIAALTGAVQSAGDFDLLLVSGGSSVGDYDRTPAALELLGFSLLSRRVNARPGKPLVLARRGQQWAVGLPGNPVSHFVAFHVFVTRVLHRLASRTPPPPQLATLTAPPAEAADHRETFWPARVALTAGRLYATPMPWLDSGDLRALIGVNGLIHLPAHARPAGGDAVAVILCGPLS